MAGRLSRGNKIGLSFEDSPAGGEDVTVLFVAAEFGYQYHYDDNWQSDQREYEKNSKAHHGVCLLAYLYNPNIVWQCTVFMKLRIRLIKGRCRQTAPISDHSAQHESLAGSLKYEIAAIFNASAIVG